MTREELEAKTKEELIELVESMEYDYATLNAEKEYFKDEQEKYKNMWYEAYTDAKLFKNLLKKFVQ